MLIFALKTKNREFHSKHEDRIELLFGLCGPVVLFPAWRTTCGQFDWQGDKHH